MLKLRPYQEEALDVSLRKWRNGVNRQLIALPTGTGKTVIFANLLRHHEIDGRMLVLVHRRELAEQAAKAFKRWALSVQVGIDMGDSASHSKDQVVIAGVQSLNAQNASRLRKKFSKKDFTVAVCDEAHHSVAPSFKGVLDYLGFLSSEKKLLLGMTATPVRADGKSLGSIYQEMIYNMPLLRAIELGYLCDLRGYRVGTRTNLDHVKCRRGDFEEESLSRAINTPERNEMIVRVWEANACHRSTIVFCGNIRHGKDVASAFQRNGVSAECVWGGDPERDSKIEQHKRGKIKVLMNCALLTEGYDDQNIAAVVLARPTQSEPLYAQMIGRGTRVGTSGKKDCVVIDVVDNTSKHQLVTLPVLIGQPDNHDLAGQSLRKRLSGTGVRTEIPCSSPNPYTLHTAEVKEIDLFAGKWRDDVLARTILRWYQNQSGVIVMPLPGNSRIEISNNESWCVTGNIAGTPLDYHEFMSPEAAVRFAETMLRRASKGLGIDFEGESLSDRGAVTPLQALLASDLGIDIADCSRAEAAGRITAEFETRLNAQVVANPDPQSGSAENRGSNGTIVIKCF